MKLYVWRQFFGGLYTQGFAVAMAENVEQARELIREQARSRTHELPWLSQFVEEELATQLIGEPDVYDTAAADFEAGRS